MDDPLEALKRVTAQDNDAAFRGRVEKERRLQTRARKTRATLGWLILGFAGVGCAVFFLGVMLESFAIQALSCLCFFAVIVLGTVLFFMGGVASPDVREVLSEREKKLLDN